MKISNSDYARIVHTYFIRDDINKVLRLGQYFCNSLNVVDDLLFYMDNNNDALQYIHYNYLRKTSEPTQEEFIISSKLLSKQLGVSEEICLSWLKAKNPFDGFDMMVLAEKNKKREIEPFLAQTEASQPTWRPQNLMFGGESGDI